MRILNSSSAGYLEIFFPLLWFVSLGIYCLHLKMEAYFYRLHLYIMNFQLHQRHLRLIFFKNTWSFFTGCVLCDNSLFYIRCVLSLFNLQSQHLLYVNFANKGGGGAGWLSNLCNDLFFETFPPFRLCKK